MAVAEPPFLSPAARRLLLFGGKGGVGKTTCASATAVRWALRAPGERFLLASTDPAHSVCDCLAGSAPANLSLLEIDAAASLRRFKEAQGRHLREIALRGTFLAEDEVDALFDLSLPGLDELMAFLEIADLVEGGGYAAVLVDTAPMGHTLRFLGLFEVMRRWLELLDAMLAKHRFLSTLYQGEYQPGPADEFLRGLGRSLGHLAGLLRDPARSLFVPVLLAEHLGVLQTRRLLSELNRLGVPVADLIVNRLHPAESACVACREARRREGEQLGRLGGELCAAAGPCRQGSNLQGDKASGKPAATPGEGLRLWQVPLQEEEVRGARLAAFWDDCRPVGFAGAGPAPAAAALPRVDGRVTLPAAGVRLVLVGGKGGVGKTTVACATALRLAEAYPDRQVLLFSTDPAHSLSGCLDVPVGPREVRVRPGLTAVEIDAAAEFARLKQAYADEVGELFEALTGGGSVGVGFDRAVEERLLDLAPPGLDEVMALTRVVALLEAGTYGLFVLDTAPSGHLIRLLELPQLAQSWLRLLFSLVLKYKNVFRLPRTNALLVELSRGLKALQALLGDPARGMLLAVSALTQLCFERTRDLLRRCRQAEVATPALVLNLATAGGPCPLCRAVAGEEGRVRDRFEGAFPGLVRSVIYRGGEPRGLDRLSELGRALYGG
jgi:arsenite-transporting ATPase